MVNRVYCETTVELLYWAAIHLAASTVGAGCLDNTTFPRQRILMRPPKMLWSDPLCKIGANRRNGLCPDLIYQYSGCVLLRSPLLPRRSVNKRPGREYLGNALVNGLREQPEQVG